MSLSDVKPGQKVRHTVSGRQGTVLQVRFYVAEDGFDVRVEPETALPAAWVTYGSDAGKLPVWWSSEYVTEALDPAPGP